MNGIILDMPEREYHAHPALSSTQARRLLESPAKYRHALTEPEKPKAAFDLGTAVHSKVLGTGAPTVVIPEDLLAANGAVSTKAAKEWIEQARAEGHTPVKQAVADEVNAMTEAALAHPMARVLLGQPGHPETSVFATDPDTGLELRARFDYLPSARVSGQVVAVDLKTAADASPNGFTRAAASHGYHIQRAHYMDVHEYADAPVELDGFAFVVVESTAPYLVGVYRLRSDWEAVGVAKAREACRILRHCLDTDTWAGYGDGIQSLMPPFWLTADSAEPEIAA